MYCLFLLCIVNKGGKIKTLKEKTILHPFSHMHVCVFVFLVFFLFFGFFGFFLILWCCCFVKYNYCVRPYGYGFSAFCVYRIRIRAVSYFLVVGI